MTDSPITGDLWFKADENRYELRWNNPTPPYPRYPRKDGQVILEGLEIWTGTAPCALYWWGSGNVHRTPLGVTEVQDILRDPSGFIEYLRREV